jgi:hypothetical protein
MESISTEIKKKEMNADKTHTLPPSYVTRAALEWNPREPGKEDSL